MKGNILVADDEAVIVKALTKYLAQEGYGVESASDGAEAIEKIKESTFDILITDLKMPNMDGIAFIEKLKSQSRLRRIPVIMLTARCEPQDIAAASSLGISDYITKPFDFTQLMDKVRAALSDRKS